MTTQLLVDGATALTWAVVAYKLPSFLRRPHHPVKRFYWLSLFLEALALTVLLPPLYRGLDWLLGVPNAARLVGDGLGVVASWTIQALLLHVNYPAERAHPLARRVGWGIAVAVVVMACCFALAPAQPEDPAFSGHYEHTPFMAEYRLVFLACLAVAMTNVARLSWRYATIADRAALRVGLRVVAVAGVIGLGYTANEALRVAAGRVGFTDPVPQPTAVSQMLIAGFMSLGLVGTTMPAWGPCLGIPVLVDWLRRYRAVRCLYPLWRDLRRAYPAIALYPTPSPFVDLVTWRDLRFRLYRRVVEIRDGWLRLRPYRDPRVTEVARALCAAAALSEAETRAVLDAADLATALRAKVQGRLMHHGTPRLEIAGSLDVERETAALERVARCYRRSPIVRRIVARLEWDAADGMSADHATG